MEAASVASGIIAILDVVVAGTLVWYARRAGYGLPRLVLLLAAFFVLRAVSRVVAIFVGYSQSAELATDFLLLTLLVILLTRVQDLANGLSVAADAARIREYEYERARAHYTQVVRHRIANPLTVIQGAAHTLEAGIGDEATRRELVRAILESSEVLERVSLDPQPQGDEERELLAVPRPGVSQDS